MNISHYSVKRKMSVAAGVIALLFYTSLLHYMNGRAMTINFYNNKRNYLKLLNTIYIIYVHNKVFYSVAIAFYYW